MGGGIWNGMPFAPEGPVPSLLLENSVVARNTLSASPGLAVAGGGLYTAGFAVTLQGERVIAVEATDSFDGVYVTVQTDVDNGHRGFYDIDTSNCVRAPQGKWWENGSSG